jgi:hypothetical protein
MLFAADWARELTGRDPAAPFRGTYADEAGAMAIVTRAGGWVPLVQDALDGCGWERVLDPSEQEGDVILGVPPHHGVPVACIATTGGRAALLTRHGLVVWPVPRMWAWRHG